MFNYFYSVLQREHEEHTYLSEDTTVLECIMKNRFLYSDED